MPSFLDKVKGAIFEEEKKPVSTTAPLSVSKSVTGSTFGNTPYVVEEPNKSAPVPDLIDAKDEEERIKQTILNHASFKPVADFLKVVDSMKGVIADEGTRFKAAQAASQTDPSTLMASIQTVPGILTGEQAEFENGFVAGKTAEIQNLQHNSDQAQASIDELTGQLGKLSQYKAELDQKIREGQVGLEKSKIDFKSILNTALTSYGDLANKLAKHLGGTHVE